MFVRVKLCPQIMFLNFAFYLERLEGLGLQITAILPCVSVDNDTQSEQSKLFIV